MPKVNWQSKLQLVIMDIEGEKKTEEQKSREITRCIFEVRVEQKSHFYFTPLCRHLWLLKCSLYQGSSAGGEVGWAAGRGWCSLGVSSTDVLF